MVLIINKLIEDWRIRVYNNMQRLAYNIIIHHFLRSIIFCSFTYLIEARYVVHWNNYCLFFCIILLLNIFILYWITIPKFSNNIIIKWAWAVPCENRMIFQIAQALVRYTQERRNNQLKIKQSKDNRSTLIKSSIMFFF